MSVSGKTRSAGRSIGGAAHPAVDPSVMVKPSPATVPDRLRSARARWARALAVLAAVALLASACGGEDEPELTLEDRLEVIEGRPLTAVEVADRLSVASALCEMDEPILNAVWRRLTEEQLEFQDFVFAHICPDRSVFYAGLTGRYVTEEAENSGVVTSTTPPIRTTTTVETTTSVSSTAPITADDSGSTTIPAAGDDEDTETTEVVPDAASTTTTTAPAATTPPEGEGG